MTDVDILGLTQTGLKKKSLDKSLDDLGVQQLVKRDPRPGRWVMVESFAVDSFVFDGGSIDIPTYGTWYVGVELSSKMLRTLPRLGHRGWIPLARVEANNTRIVSIKQLTPKIPECRIPNVMKKILSGQTYNVLIMGSSLTEGTGTTRWSGMCFDPASSPNKYRYPGTPVLRNVGLGGTPNQYQLAQLGFASRHSSTNYTDSGYGLQFGPKVAPNGRSNLFDIYDLVVIGCLANGGDYRLECIEAIARKLKQQGKDVIFITDNTQNPTLDYNAAMQGGLYSDGPEVFRVADLYNCEVADTAAYVLDGHIRAGGDGIYSDSIHQASGEPNGPTQTPANGHELYARAIRSLVHARSIAIEGAFRSLTYNFDENAQGFYRYGNQVTDVSYDSTNKRMICAKSTDTSDQWGIQVLLPFPVYIGDVIRVRGKVTTLKAPGDEGWAGPVVGMQGGGSGWASGQQGLGINGTFDVSITQNRTATSEPRLLFFANRVGAKAGTAFTLDDIIVDVQSQGSVVSELTVTDRSMVNRPLPPCRIVSDYKTPGDAFIILPFDEIRRKSSQSNAGTLSAHPAGAGSFARRFSSLVGSNEDLLTLTTGQAAAISAHGVVGMSLILYSVSGNPAATIEIYTNNSLKKTINIAAQTLTREVYMPIYTPTEYNRLNEVPDNGVIDIRVTQGTVRIAALVALTFDMDYYPPEAATRIGTWTGKLGGGMSNMPGYATDTANDYAVFNCPPTGRRVAWVCSSKPNSKPINTWSDKYSKLAEATAGTNHIKSYGNHIGPGAAHYIQCVETLSGGGNSANGYALHVGGIIVINDR